jgi:hypothetical protein
MSIVTHYHLKFLYIYVNSHNLSHQAYIAVLNFRYLIILYYAFPLYLQNMAQKGHGAPPPYQGPPPQYVYPSNVSISYQGHVYMNRQHKKLDSELLLQM